jgi:hypothetical protein
LSIKVYPVGMKAGLPIVLTALILAGCAGVSQLKSSEAAWARGQCAQIVDRKQHEKCLERVEEEYGR